MGKQASTAYGATMLPGRHLQPRRGHLAVSVLLVVAGLVAAVTMPADAEPGTRSNEEAASEDRTTTTSATSTTTSTTAATADVSTPVPAPSRPGTTPAPAAPTTTPPTTEAVTEAPPTTTAPLGDGSPPPSTPCDGTRAKTDGGTWHCAFSDEFTGTTLDANKWRVLLTSESGYRAGPNCYVDRPETVSVSGGALRLSTVKGPNEACPYGNDGVWTPYMSGNVTSMGKFSQAFGRYEFRVKFPGADVIGLHSAIWLWPDAASYYGVWPASGEIDIAEVFSRFPDRAIPYVHYLGGEATSKVTNNFCLVSNLDEWHTYVLEWTGRFMQISYDGQVCLTTYWSPLPPLFKPQPFDRPFHINLTQGLGVGNNKFDAARTPLPATMSVDYVRVWR